VKQQNNKVTKAQRQIRKVLKSQNSDKIQVTPDLVLRWWRQLNVAVFDSKLRAPVKITCDILEDGEWGWTKPVPYIRGSSVFTKDVEIGIHTDVDDWQTFLTVLAHEMVHQYEWVYASRLSHGPKHFYSWKPILQERVGLSLDKYIDVSLDQ